MQPRACRRAAFAGARSSALANVIETGVPCSNNAFFRAVHGYRCVQPQLGGIKRAFMLGVSTEKRTPGGGGRTLASTSRASASCGTHLGDTKLVTSTARRPASTRRSTSSTLTSVGTCRGAAQPLMCLPPALPSPPSALVVTDQAADGLQDRSQLA